MKPPLPRQPVESRRRVAAPRQARQFLDRFGGAANRPAKGGLGEDAACAHLTANGYRIVARNWRTRYGEIDVVAECGEFLCFVEVKARRNSDYGRPEEAVTAAKQRQIVRTAQAYLKVHGGFDRPCRFDVVALTGTPEGWEIETIPNAFQSR